MRLPTVIQKLNSTKARVAGAATTAMLAVSASSHAALDGAVKSAIQSGFGDASEAAGLMVIGFAGIFAVMLVVRLIRR